MIVFLRFRTLCFFILCGKVYIMLYWGNSFKEVDIKILNGNVIYQMMWEGRLFCKFELDFPIMNFGIADADYDICIVS